MTRIVVIGQGYVGLPLAVRAVEVGFEVVGYDTDKRRVDLLQRAKTFIDDVTDAQLATMLASGRYRPTADATVLAGFDVAVVSVPTPLRDGVPDLSYVKAAAVELGPHLRTGCCVVLESTTYPGTTEDVFIPLLEAGSALRAGRDYCVGYSPERIDPGNPRWTLKNTPKIVSGLDERSLDAVVGFYEQLVDQVVPVRTIREAELAKLLENTFRHVNIALVNELAMYCHGLGIDIWSVLDAAASKPFGFMKFTPGPGVGGHCLPIDPSYLQWQVRRAVGSNFRFIDIANDINDHMPDYVVTRVAEHLNRRYKAVNGSSILLVGLAYKANSGDARQSPALEVARRLADRGALLTAVDPLIDPQQVPPFVRVVPLTTEHVECADLVLVLTDHDALDWSLLERWSARILDTRNRVRSAEAERL
ncbi:UDP-N-acetyl-D-mannosaminuronic acid dehydrogenase/UDP-N-acetyl-D-glucosamine dehydrogenase [Pseudonocardia hierapolitana]|uniref:UDP-N-acetyl-D-mannosaminuronic acid dehydrogenase/UDP-N-acetyl-D-glucosamine dehydrogenase n=1 Tax=Pseudonocardia hierapolitana TaxID=1128676 RepID=A0A561SW00_9PSEU|nr:nucleotide sugar dehydrogenase [Pseudonocardia hierapolitana]TWF79035.1 UDP-N-acetyl-D-mannosaminuronic acid dehydrogenase/UDP-N-acetyl-D-glucosamine dehydrogenase [Pseudonocardia hierapolitana]